MGLVLLGLGLWIGHAWRRRDIRAGLARIGVGHLALYVVLLAWLLPAFNPSKTYKPQGEWIRAQIGNARHFGLVYPEFGYRKMGGFGYYSGALVERMETAEQVRHFFEQYPTSVVLVHEDSVDRIFAEDETEWRRRVLRELRTGKHLYVVVGAPVAVSPNGSLAD